MIAATVVTLPAWSALAASSAPAAPQRPAYPMAFTVRQGTRSCAPLTKTVSGTIQGVDRRAVNAQIAFDLLDASGRAVDGNGCRGVSGYGVSVHVNYSLPASGVDPSDPRYADAVTTWSVSVPSNVSKAFVEVYPKKQSSQPRFGVTDRSHYGMTMYPRAAVSANTAPKALALPTNDCTAAHATGTVVGRFLLHGRPVRGVRASAFSEAAPPSDPIANGPLGLSIWTGKASQYRLSQVASGPGKGQAYVIVAKLENGVSKKFYMYDGTHHRQVAGVRPCGVTTFDLRF